MHSCRLPNGWGRSMCLWFVSHFPHRTRLNADQASESAFRWTARIRSFAPNLHATTAPEARACASASADYKRRRSAPNSSAGYNVTMKADTSVAKPGDCCCHKTPSRGPDPHRPQVALSSAFCLSLQRFFCLRSEGSRRTLGSNGADSPNLPLASGRLVFSQRRSSWISNRVSPLTVTLTLPSRSSSMRLGSTIA